MPDDCNTPQPFDNPWTRWFFAGCILFVLYLIYLLVQPFLIPLFMAVVLVVVAGPSYSWFNRKLGGRSYLASGITCLLLIVIIAVPFFFIAGVLASQALDLYTTMSQMLSSQELHATFNRGLGRLQPLLDELQRNFGISQHNMLSEVGNWVRDVSSVLYRNLTGLLRGVTNLVIGFVLVLFVTFYLLMDGAEMANKAIALSPLPDQMNSQIKRDILESIQATLRGSLVLALIHGAAGGLGFWIFGVPLALFWGTVMVFASVVPLVGTALVWLPAGIYLMILGSTGQAIGVMIWCLATALIGDNILRPRLVGGKTNLHPLLTFFSILGGLSVFGMVGLVLGPLILALAISLIKVYQSYILDISRKGSPAPGPAAAPQAAGEAQAPPTQPE